MARTVKKETALHLDSEALAEDIADDEFDDELTEPVLSVSDAADDRRDDRREGPVAVSEHSLNTAPARDEPGERDSAVGSHINDEYTAPVLLESEKELHVDDESHEEPVAVPEHSSTGMPDDDTPLEPGFLLRDRFEIVELIHTGGMSRVYKAIDHRRHPPGSEQSLVAIKMLRPSALPKHDAPAVLEREAAAAQRLSHPNIINIFDFDMHDEHFYLVMEWLEGESVKELLQRRISQPLAPEFAWQIIHEVAAALEHAHLNDVVHADINLSNIFITDTKQIKLLDFGVSRHGGSEEVAANDQMIWVTHKYASPEILSGSAPVFADDVFALGCVAYRLLSGRHPFAGASSLQAKESRLTVHPVPGLPSRQQQVLRQALAYTRADRPTTVSVFLDQQPTWLGDVMQRVRDVPHADWLVALSVAAVAAVAIGAGLWSLLRTSTTEEAIAVRQPTIVADPALIEARHLTTANSEQKLIDGIARAEKYIAARRLTLPPDDSAYSLLLELRQQHGNDDRLQATTDRLIDRLMAEAAIAAAAREDADAVRLLNAAKSLGAIPAEIERTGQVLTMNAEEASDKPSAVATAPTPAPEKQTATLPTEAKTTPNQAENLTAASAAEEDVQVSPFPVEAESLGADAGEIEQPGQPGAIDAGNLPDEPPAVAAAGTALSDQQPTPTVAAGATSQLPVENAGITEDPTSSNASETGVPAQPRFVSLADMNIEKYVAPVYPRGARRRGLTGNVEMNFRILADGSTGGIEVLSSQPGDIFVAAATKAVSKWRFEPPGEIVTAQVNIRFDEE